MFDSSTILHCMIWYIEYGVITKHEVQSYTKVQRLLLVEILFVWYGVWCRLYCYPPTSLFLLPLSKLSSTLVYPYNGILVVLPLLLLLMPSPSLEQHHSRWYDGWLLCIAYCVWWNECIRTCRRCMFNDARLAEMHVRQRVYCFYNCNNAIVVDGGGSVIIFICLYYLLVRWKR